MGLEYTTNSLKEDFKNNDNIYSEKSNPSFYKTFLEVDPFSRNIKNHDWNINDFYLAIPFIIGIYYIARTVRKTRKINSNLSN